jgi:hypothetical protein
MWEAKAAAARLDRLVDWVRRTALPSLGEPGPERVEVFSDGAERVVVITWWSGEPVELPSPPAELVARPPHAWRFFPVAS